MSTQPLERRHVRPAARRPYLRRALTIGVMFAATFAAAFVVGHTRGGAAEGEHLPPSIPKVPTPVSATLSAAPAIDVGALKPPPAPPTHTKTPSSAATTTPAVTTPAVTTPAVTTPAVKTPAATAPTAPAAKPTPTQSTPVQQSKPSTPVQPAPHTSGGSGKSSSGSGTSFESSG